MAELAGKTSLVTGAGVGIGRAIAMKLASEGARVLVVDFNEETAEQAVNDIVNAGGEAKTFVADVSDETRVASMVKAAIDQWGTLDIACNSAAVSRGSGPIHTFDKAVFDQTLDLCLTNTFLCMKYEIEAMLEQGSGGSIINISSNASLRGQPYNTAYAAAKSGVNLLTKSAAAEYGHKGIRINAVSPGVIRTPGVEKYFEEQPKIAEGLKQSAVMGRLGEPSEIAEAVCFFASDRASFITGQLLSVDGGGAIK